MLLVLITSNQTDRLCTATQVRRNLAFNLKTAGFTQHCGFNFLVCSISPDILHSICAKPRGILDAFWIPGLG